MMLGFVEDTSLVGIPDWQMYVLVVLGLFVICGIADLWNLIKSDRKKAILDDVRWLRQYKTTQNYRDAKERNKRERHKRLEARRAKARNVA